MDDFESFKTVSAIVIDAFKDVRVGTLIQRSIVVASTLTVGWFGYAYFVRPRGTSYWIRGQAADELARSADLSRQVAEAEGEVDVLEEQLRMMLPAASQPPTLKPA